MTPGLRVGSVVAALVLAGCGGSDDAVDDDPFTRADTTSVAPPADTSVDCAVDDTGCDRATPGVETLYPDVVDATATLDGDTWTISATLSSPYDSPERYADAWRVVGPDGTVYGERLLTHDHAAEQPFTRSQSGIEIPDDVTEVVIEGRDQLSGWGGATFSLRLPR